VVIQFSAPISTLCHTEVEETLSKQIWLAPILSNNRKRLIERSAEMLASDGADSFLYLAASRPLLDAVISGLLDGERNRGVWGTLPVFLFHGFARHVMATAVDDESGLPLPPRIPIDRDELPLKRSLISRVMLRLLREGKLKALGPLAHREGCVNTVARLIGEIQRAAKSPFEFASIVEARARDFNQDGEPASAIPRQIDFDREIGVIYTAYQESLDGSQLTEDDADQLRALDALRGELDGKRVRLPWLSEVKLLVLDGFFDFTPAQGEMLRLLIPSIPDVIVNLNRDERNAEIFRPFDATIDQLNSIAHFETKVESEILAVAGSLTPLRERLFNSGLVDDRAAAYSTKGAGATNITFLECSDRQTEIRAIVKRIKRLVHLEGYELSEIALVVRELASYTDVIARVFEEESVPCSLERRMRLADVPAARAALKLFELLMKLVREGDATLKASELASLVKSGYFRLPEVELAALRARFNQEDAHLWDAGGFRRGPSETNVGQWDPDELENVIAFVGAELRIENWLGRARKLTAQLRDPRVEEHLASDLEEESDSDEGSSTPVADETFSAVKRRSEWVEPVDIPDPSVVFSSCTTRTALPAVAIVLPPVFMRLYPDRWATFPWSALAADANAIAPMSYWTSATPAPRCAAGDQRYCAYQYTHDNVLLSRQYTGLPVHAIGGAGDAATVAQVGDYVRAARETAAAGGSFYDYLTTKPGFWPYLEQLKP